MISFLGKSLTILRLAIALCLSGRPQEALFIIAVVCSSWSAVNIATSQRDILTPLGDISRASVRCGNRMVARPAGWAKEHLNIES